MSNEELNQFLGDDLVVDSEEGPLLIAALRLLPCVVPPRFVAVSASAHIAPATAVVLGLVEEEPGAFGGSALPHEGEVVGDQ